MLKMLQTCVMKQKSSWCSPRNFSPIGWLSWCRKMLGGAVQAAREEQSSLILLAMESGSYNDHWPSKTRPLTQPWQGHHGSNRPPSGQTYGSPTRNHNTMVTLLGLRACDETGPRSWSRPYNNYSTNRPECHSDFQ